MRRPPRVIVALAAGLLLALGACGGSGDDQATVVNRPAPTAPATTLAPTTTTLAPNSSRIAEATVPVVEVYAQPGDAAPIRTFDNPWHVNEDVRFPVPLVFLAESVRDDGWVEVLLPVRPNGSTGWVRGADVRLRQNNYRVEVSVGAHHITVYQGAGVVYEGPVATGAPATPTPVGHYFIRVLIQAPDPNTVYGPFAYGLSSHSDVLSDFNGGDGEIGIHGNDDASALGYSVSHGCIRIDNDAITRLSKILPLGTPVDVLA